MAKATGIRFTRLGLNATSRKPYASFAGKAAGAVVLKKHEGFRRNVGKMMR